MIIALLLTGCVIHAQEISTPTTFTTFHSEATPHSKYKTEARVQADDHNLIFTVKCFQPEADIMAAAKLRDRDVFKDDCVEIYIDKEGKGKDYQQYIINPLGTLQDLRFRSKNWDSEGEASAQITKDYWTVMLRVPLTEIAGDNEIENGDVCIRLNICRSVPGKKYSESLLAGGVYSQMAKFIKLRLNGVTPEKLKQDYLASLRRKGIETAELETLSGKTFYDHAAAEEEKTLAKRFKALPEGMKYYFASSTNVIPNPKFEYLNRRGEPANWLKRGTGECRVSDGALEIKSPEKLELWQETQPVLDNKRRYALRGKVRSISGNNRFKIHLTGVDRSAKKLGIEKVVKTLEGPAFPNTGNWTDVELEFELPESAFRADAGIVVENGVLQVKEIELDLLGKEDKEIIISQLGYHLTGYKDAIFWSRKGGLNPAFELIENGKSVYRGTAVKVEGRPYEREAYVADFSPFLKEGTFQLRTNGMTSHPFKVGEKVYLDGMRFMLDAYYYQRQGFAQPGWKKKPDYLDDGYIVSNEARGKNDLLYLPDGKLNPKYILGHRDMSGGWRDAGDCSKQVSDGESIYMLARMQYRLNPSWRLRKGNMADLPDELWWGCSRWAEKCYMGDGTFLTPTVHVTKLSDNWVGTAPEDCTDGISGTDDDRLVFADKSADGGYQGSLHTQWMNFHTIGLTGLALKNVNPDIAATCQKVMEGYYRRLVEKYENDNLGAKKHWSRNDLTHTGSKLAYTAIYIHQLTGKREYLDMAEQVLKKIINMVNTMDVKTFDMNSSYFATIHYFNVLLEFAEFYPNSALMPELKDAIVRYIANLIIPGYDRAELFPVFNHVRLSKAYGKVSSAKGILYTSTICAFTLLRAGQITGNPEYDILAEKTLQYWMGRNPQNLSEVSGLGWRHTALMTGLAACEGHEDAVIPGIMANGFRQLDFMPIPAKPSAITPGGNIATLYGVEAWIQPTGMTMGLMSELELLYRGKKVK